jgi:hypothetical protein
MPTKTYVFPRKRTPIKRQSIQQKSSPKFGKTLSGVNFQMVVNEMEGKGRSNYSCYTKTVFGKGEKGGEE